MRQSDRGDMAEQDRGYRRVPSKARADDRDVDPISRGAEQVPAKAEWVGEQRHDVLPLNKQQQQVMGEVIADDDRHQSRSQVPSHIAGRASAAGEAAHDRGYPDKHREKKQPEADETE